MKTRLLLSSLLLGLLSMAAYFAACKKDNASNAEDTALEPISVSFSRAEILDLLSNAGSNEVAGICFMPVQEGNHINLQAILAEWNTSQNKPTELIKVMNKTVMGEITNDPCPELMASGTSEFEFGYADKEILLRFLDEEHYYPGATHQPDGIHFSRVMLDLNSGSEYKKYRGLVMKPYPLPDFSNGFTERQGIGYTVVPTCPPFWRPQ